MKQLTQHELTNKLDFIKDKKSHRILCPHCSTLYTPNQRFCRRCGEPLPKK